MKIHKPIPPGEFIKYSLIDEMDWSIAKASRELGITRYKLIKLIESKIKINIPIAKKLGKVLNTSYQKWINLQEQYDENIELPKKNTKTMKFIFDEYIYDGFKLLAMEEKISIEELIIKILKEYIKNY